jgi:hypothetical protein
MIRLALPDDYANFQAVVAALGGAGNHQITAGFAPGNTYIVAMRFDSRDTAISVGFTPKPSTFMTDFPNTIEVGTVSDIGIV